MSKKSELYSDAAVKLGQLIRDAYIAERNTFNKRLGLYSTAGYRPGPQWDGGVNSRGARYTPVWPKIGQHVLNAKVDPVQLIRAVFSYAELYPPQPNYLLSEQALQKYRAHCADATYDMTAMLRLNKEIMKSQIAKYIDSTDWDSEIILRTVLLDESSDLDPVFRYCMALQFSLPDVRDEYFVQAVYEYVRHKSIYDDHWSDIIPEEFKKAADKHYTRMVSDG